MKDVEYDYEYDSVGDKKYCYPNGVLKNKLNITNRDLLKEAEREISGTRYYQLSKEGVTGNFSLKHLMSIHRFLFQDIYEWAGKIRTVDISKGTIFCLVQFIELQFSDIYEKLAEEKFLTEITDKGVFAKRLAYFLSEINMIHPFREGNGRTQRMYIEQLCKKNGRFEIDYSKIDADMMVEASIRSSVKDYSLMEEIMIKCLSEK